jgi:hypothetical protein
MASDEQEDRSAAQEDTPHGHEGSDRPGGQIGVGVGGLGGGEKGGTQSDQGRGYGAEGGSARRESSDEPDMPHGHDGSDRPGPQVGVGTGGLGGQEWPGRHAESSGQGDEESDAEDSSAEEH